MKSMWRKNREDQTVNENPKPSRNPLIRSPLQSRLHPPEPESEPTKVRRLKIVKNNDDDDTDPAA